MRLLARATSRSGSARLGSPRKAVCRVGASDRAFRRFKAADARILNVTGRRRCQFNARSERTRDSTVLPPMRGCDAACPQAPASAAAVWAGRPLMRRLRIRRNRRTRTRSPTTEVASTDARRTNFPVSCRHSRTPIIRHGRPAKDEADLSSLRGAHEARQATALARPQTPSDPPVSVHRLRACRHGRVARVRRRGALNELRDSLGAHHTCGYRLANGSRHPVDPTLSGKQVDYLDRPIGQGFWKD